MSDSHDVGIDDLVTKIGAVLKRDESIFRRLLKGKLDETTRSYLKNLSDALTYVQAGGTCPFRKVAGKTTHYCIFPMNEVAGFSCSMYSEKKVSHLVLDGDIAKTVKEQKCTLSVKNEDSTQLMHIMIDTAEKLENNGVRLLYANKLVGFYQRLTNAKDFRDRYTRAEQEQFNKRYADALDLQSRIFVKLGRFEDAVEADIKKDMII